MTLITNPTGLDVLIQRQQVEFTDNLWTDKNYTSYGRAFINRDEFGNKVPEVYEGNEEYKEVLTDDSQSAISFFVVDSNHQSPKVASYKAKVMVVFIINLGEVYGLDHRAVEEAHRDVYKCIAEKENYKVLSLITGEQVLSDYKIKHYDFDMQPYHTFAYEIEMTYGIDISC